MLDSETLEKLQTFLQDPYWRKPDFIVFVILAILGILVTGVDICISIQAWIEATAAKREAEKAKLAANRAANVVKIQVDTGIIAEVRQDLLAELTIRTTYHQARRLLTRANGRLKRIIAPLRDHSTLAETIDSLDDALQAAREALDGVKPTTKSGGKSNAIFYAVEGPFAEIDSVLGDLSGLLDKKTMHLGEVENNGHT